MSKPVKIVIHITGYSRAQIDCEDRVVRPMSAGEIARAVTEDLNHKFSEAGLGTMKAKVVEIHIP